LIVLFQQRLQLLLGVPIEACGQAALACVAIQGAVRALSQTRREQTLGAVIRERQPQRSVGLAPY
jgi:hypothetical protein